MNTKLFVGNVSFVTSEGALFDLFGEIGTVVSCKIIVDRQTNQSRGFAFVEMSSALEASQAMKELNGRELDSRALRVSEAQERPRPHFGGEFSVHAPHAGEDRTFRRPR